MRFSNLLFISATLLLSTKDAHGASSSDYSPTISRSSPSRRNLPSSLATSTSSRKKKRRRKSKASGAKKPGLSVALIEDDMFDFSLDKLDGDEDEERLLSALDRIEELGTSKEPGSGTKKVKKASKNCKRSSSIEKAVGIRSTGLSRPTSASAIPLSKEQTISSSRKEQTPVPGPPAVRTEQTAPVSHTVTQHTYQQRTPTPTSTAGLPYPRYRPPVTQARAPPQTPQQQQRAAMLAYTTPWVINFLQAHPKDALLAVPRDFLGDGFNLVHLPPIVERLAGSSDTSFSLYKAALRLILSNEDVQNVPPSVQRAAETLYTLVHARYITSPRGLDTVRRLLVQNKEVFGKCPRPSCRGMPMLPHGGTSDYGPQQHTHHGQGNSNNCHAQRYCCCCGNVWEHWDSKVDGSAWGPSFCHLYLLTYGKDALGGRLAHSAVPQHPSTVPTIFGFQVHTAALRRMRDM